MRLNLFKASVLFIALIFIQSCAQKNNNSSSADIDKKVDELLSKMTLEEKIGQMTQLTIDAVSITDSGKLVEPHQLDTAKLREAIIDHHVGSILNVPNFCRSVDHWREIITTIQEMAAKTPNKIPVLYGIDAIHGNNYAVDAIMFPQEIAMAATWNPELTEKAAEITAYETRACYIPWNFSPVLDIGRNAAWSRIWETFGEDVYLGRTMGTAMIKGYQGNDISDKYKVASCLKHYMGYGFPLTGKDRTQAWIPDIYLREYFLPAFADAIAAGAPSVMVNSSEINGVPAHASHYLLTEILRNELHFEGFTVSDWEDIIRLYKKHHVAATPKEAVKIAVMAGIDMSMVPYDYSFYNYLLELVKEGSVPESRINEAVKRILKVKFQLGLFENPLGNPADYPDFGSEKHRQVAVDAAREAITLLKNEDNVLPLSKDGRVLVTGFAANTMATLNGGWSHTWQGDIADTFAQNKNTILEAIQAKIGADHVSWAEGTKYDSLTEVSKALQLAHQADYIVLCLGEMSYCEQFGTINDMYLPEPQEQLAKKLAATGKPVILVLTEGRPRIISKFAKEMKGIMMAYLPGNEGGDAIADILFGDVNPSGKLPITYPIGPNILTTYDNKYTDNVPEIYAAPQFEFGFGLSYTTFSYSNLKVSKAEISMNDSLQISVDVSNTGNRKGKEVVQLYISDLYASITPPVKRLRGFSKIELEPGQKSTVSFKIHTNDLAFVDANSKWVTEPGEFEVTIGDQKAKFLVK
jgi:beta-glucosidase